MAKIDNVSDTTSAGLTLPRDVKVPMPEPTQSTPAPIPFAKPNGPTPPAIKDPRGALERGLLQFDVLRAERDQLEKDLFAARERIHMLEIQINELEGTRGTIESRIHTCVLERDQAVRESGACLGVIEAIALVCNKYLEKADANR